MVAVRAHANGKSPVHAMFQMYFSGLEVLGQTYDPFSKGLARAQLEFMGLMSRRAQAYMEIPGRLSQCRTPQDLANEQFRFWRTAYEEYAESTGRMAEAMASFTLQPFDLARSVDEPDNAHDYITFPEPEPAQRSRHAREKRAA